MEMLPKPGENIENTNFGLSEEQHDNLMEFRHGY